MMFDHSRVVLRCITQALQETVVAFDEQGRIHFWSPQGLHLFGYTEEEVVGRSVASLLDPGTGGMDWSSRLRLPTVTTVTANCQPWRVEECVRRSDGQLLNVEMNLWFWHHDNHRYYTAAIRSKTDASNHESHNMRAYVNRIAISALLEVGLESLPLSSKLEVALNIVLTVPWLAVQHKGSIFLAAPDGELEMVVQQGLHSHLLQACRRVPLGHCLCGLAAQRRTILFAPHLDADHVIRYDGIHPHGHYCIPIMARQQLVGVLNLYVDDGHQANAEEEAFFTTIANTLASLIERGRVEEQINHLAHHDPLTGLPNRRLFLELLDQELKHAQRRQHAVAVVFLDLDHFKAVNDTLGHDAGDQLLRAVVLRLRRCLRDSDTLARMGGDEFTLILPAIDHVKGAIAVVTKMLQVIQEPFVIAGTPCAIGLSIGISLYPDHGSTKEALTQRADQAMYQVKRHGRNHYRLFSDHDARDKPDGEHV
ncbi:MAG: diguanylate cyclase [Magnetococcales bacterium]|nr:diguanylate cyclase [Magnetococcales bacterium]